MEEIERFNNCNFNLFFNELNEARFMNMNNHKEVTANDNSIKRQVPGVLTEAEKKAKPNQNKDQEYYFRVTDYRGY